MSKSTQGMAMLYALLLMVVIVGVGALMFARTVAEIQHSGDDAAIVQTLLLARGAANVGGQTLQGAVREELNQLVEIRSSTTGRWSFGSSGSGSTSTTPNAASVQTDLASLRTELQTNIDAVICGASTFNPSSGGQGSFVIYFTENACGEPLPAGVSLPGGRFVSGLPRSGTSASAEQTYALPFAMIAVGSLADYNRNVVLQGEYRFTVGRGSFSKYALFTNVHAMSNGSGDEVWFTEDTLFDGPVHTNQFFRFYRNPWFGGRVTSAGCNEPRQEECRNNNFRRRGAEFFGVGFVNQDDMRPSMENPSYRNGSGTHAPDISEVDWRASFVPLPENNQNQAQAALDGGLYFNGDVSRLQLWAADSAGNALTPDGRGGYTTTAAFQYIEVVTSERQQVRRCGWLGCRWEWEDVDVTTTYRYAEDGALYRQVDGNWEVERPEFNGVLFVNGDVQRFAGPSRTPAHSSNPDAAPPALASFAQLTLAADEDIQITGDLKYESPPCTGVPTRNSNGSVTAAQCDNLDVANVLGVFTQDGNIEIGNNNIWDRTLDAPDNVTIHGVLMTSTGTVQVEDFRRGGARGAVNLMGGIIEHFYGAFGTFNSQTGEQTNGYDRKFTYDQRMSLGVEPPFFPTVTQDGVRDVIVFSFGQREQVY